MEYAAVVILLIIVIILYRLYKRATRHLNKMTVFMMMILLDEEIYLFERDDMINHIPSEGAEDDLELGSIALISYQRHVNNFGEEIYGKAFDLLWKLKTRS